MIITYYGLTCFRIQTNGAALLIDPYDKKVGLELPRMQNDIILLSQKELAKPASEKTFFIEGPGEYEVKDIFIYGLPVSGEQDNGTAFFIQAEDINILHLGLSKQFKPTEEQKEMIEEADILMISVGGGEGFNAKQAADLVNDLEPRIVIPMNYELPKLKIKLDSLDKFIKEVGAKVDKVDKLKIGKKDLPQEETKMIIIEPA